MIPYSVSKIITLDQRVTTKGPGAHTIPGTNSLNRIHDHASVSFATTAGTYI